MNFMILRLITRHSRNILCVFPVRLYVHGGRHDGQTEQSGAAVVDRQSFSVSSYTQIRQNRYFAPKLAIFRSFSAIFPYSAYKFGRHYCRPVYHYGAATRSAEPLLLGQTSVPKL